MSSVKMCDIAFKSLPSKKFSHEYQGFFYEKDSSGTMRAFRVTFSVEIEGDNELYLGDCVKILTLLPGQVVTMSNTATQRTTIYNENSEMYESLDRSTTDVEIFNSVKDSLKRLHSTDTTSYSQNTTEGSVGGSFGVDLGFISFGGGGGYDWKDVQENFTKTIHAELEQSISAATTHVRQSRTNQNFSSVSSVITSTQQDSTSEHKGNTFRNLSDTLIAVYKFYMVHSMVKISHNVVSVEPIDFKSLTRVVSLMAVPHSNTLAVTKDELSKQDYIPMTDGVIPTTSFMPPWDQTDITTTSFVVPDANVETVAPVVPDAKVETVAPVVPDAKVETVDVPTTSFQQSMVDNINVAAYKPNVNYAKEWLAMFESKNFAKTVYIPIDGFYIAGSNGCKMNATPPSR